MRLTNEQLQAVMKKYGVDRLYSWSRINCFMTSSYEYFLSYVLHKKPDYDNSSYGVMGGLVHQQIEDYYSGKIGYDDMLTNFEDGWITAIDIVDLKFDRNNEEKNESIKEKYKYNLEHFFTHHKIIEHKVELERFLTTKIGNNVLQGYADAITKTDDGDYLIIDWKSSSIYQGKTLEEHSGQLTIYAMALIQRNIPLEKVKIAFNFLKYCTVEYVQANGKSKSRNIERCKIGESLQSVIKQKLKKHGYADGEIDTFLKMLLDTNDIKCLPEDVKDEFTFSDCYVYVPLDQKLIDKWTDEICKVIDDIKWREKEYGKTHNESLFWDSEESVKKQSYYFATLCGYSPALHKPYGEYIRKLEERKNGDIFSGIGRDEVISSNPTSKQSYGNGDDLDMSWLESI